MYELLITDIKQRSNVCCYAFSNTHCVAIKVKKVSEVVEKQKLKNMQKDYKI